MAYPSVTSDAAIDIINDWIKLANDYKAAANNKPEQARLQKLMDQLGEDIKIRMIKDIAVIERGFAEHQQKVAKWEKEAEGYLNDVKQAVASYKKSPTKLELPGQIKHFTKQVTDRATAIDRDAHDYGDSWRTYRANPWGGTTTVLKFPDKFTSEFMSRRTDIINDQKAIGTALEKVRAMKREADSLALIVNKAAMKQGIKAGVDTQRPITEARKIAADGALQIAALLQDFKVPNNLQPKPDSITQNAHTLKTLVDNKNWPKDAQAMKTYDGVWKNAEAGYRRMVTLEANMKKLYVNVQKGLRSTELKDAEVKRDLAKIVTDIKAASALLKAKAKDYAVAKAMYPKIVAGFKAKKK